MPISSQPPGQQKSWKLALKLSENNEKWISASVEPSGLCFGAKMGNEEWEKWVKDIKAKATQILGFKVGEIELGEVGHEIEWLHDKK